MASIAIPHRFNGPPDSGNGGYSAGRLAVALGGDEPIEVSLRAPIPIDTEMSGRVGDGGAGLLDGATVIAEAPGRPPPAAPPPPPSLEEARAAMRHAPFLDP